MGVSINGGTPISGSKRMVYFMENTNLTLMICGYPYGWFNPHMMMLTRKNGDSMGLFLRYILGGKNGDI